MHATRGKFYRSLDEVPGKSSHLSFSFDLIEVVVSVNCNQSFGQMLDASGCTRKHHDINPANFPIVDVGMKDVKCFLVCFRNYILVSEIERNLNILGFKSGRVEHLLALGSTYPDKRVGFPAYILGSSWANPIITLGSSWINLQDERVVPCLTECVGERVLDLFRADPSAPLDGGYWVLASELIPRLSLAS